MIIHYFQLWFGSLRLCKLYSFRCIECKKVDIHIRENRCIINWNGRIFRHLKWQSSWNLTRFHYFDTVLRKIDSFNCNDVVRFLFFIPWVPLNLCKIIGSIVLTTWWQSEKIEFFKWTTIYEASYKIQLEIIV